MKSIARLPFPLVFISFPLTLGFGPAYFGRQSHHPSFGFHCQSINGGFQSIPHLLRETNDNNNHVILYAVNDNFNEKYAQSSLLLNENEEGLDIILPVRKPLGCTVEESHVESDGGAIFVSKMTSGGNAHKAGLQIGDVITGISNANDIINVGSSVSGNGIDDLKEIVGSEAPNVPLTLRIIRGSSIMARHEASLLEEVMDIVMPFHKPLGCTVEETLADADEGSLFVAKVKPGGNADIGGLQVGDVISGVSGAFNDIVKVGANYAGEVGIDQLKQIIGTRSESVPLTLRIIRGTEIMERHEAALEEFCLLPGGTDESLKSCIDNIHTATEFEDAEEKFDVVMDVHKPLGCTVDESIAAGDFGSLFVTRVKSGGNSEDAGLMVGDVIIGVSDAFDDIVKVGPDAKDGGGIDKLKNLLVCHPENMSLTLRVIRGSCVKGRHDSAVEELCFLPGTDSTTLKSCIDTIHIEDEIDLSEVSCDEECRIENDDCGFLNEMRQMWAGDLNDCFPTPVSSSKKRQDIDDDRVVISDDLMASLQSRNVPQAEEIEPPKKKKVMPWSSRSSPSGTFVRNPRTGKMENIDA